ncbi:glycosyltransferase [Turneriella parva]|uniref:Glycosyltransferase subfamily 4-like N-terminal domain-containing protein n=1 Tax=Turneriella parva (strain ATCC BAA-1111 / DSM 21527 / NCTC 11395 / H) TaxID=869212 RepID=I4B118_TURPD|nr:glycosyltransferase [Turneriella parva]AFM10975.1 hypothetical protein Turpa_0315 [Turneriella parva DSM 21527]
MPKTVISITPLPLYKDSRTLKIARSIHELGYQSLVWDTQNVRAYPISELPTLPAATKALANNTRKSTLLEFTWRTAKRILTWLGVKQMLRVIGVVVWFRTLVDLFRNARTIRRTLPPADLYYLHSLEFGIIILWRRMTANIPYVYDAHDFYIALHQQKWWQPLHILERLLIKYSAGFVTVSDGVGELYTKTFQRTPVVIPNTQYLPKRNRVTIRKLLRLKKHDFLIVSICRPVEGRAVWPIMEAMMAIDRSNLHLAFIGDGYQEHARTIQARGATSRIHFLPPLAPEMVTDFIADANLGFMPYYVVHENLRQALPNGFFQCVAAGLPVLYDPKLVEIGRICSEYMNGIEIDPLDSDNLAKLIRHLSQSVVECQRLKKNAQKAARHFNWRLETPKIKALLENAIKKSAVKQKG